MSVRMDDVERGGQRKGFDDRRSESARRLDRTTHTLSVAIAGTRVPSRLDQRVVRASETLARSHWRVLTTICMHSSST